MERLADLLGELGDGVREPVVVQARVLGAAAHELRRPLPADAEAVPPRLRAPRGDAELNLDGRR
jgi:hypothetical protein